MRRQYRQSLYQNNRVCIYVNHYVVGGGLPDAPLAILTVNIILCGFEIFLIIVPVNLYNRIGLYAGRIGIRPLQI